MWVLNTSYLHWHAVPPTSCSVSYTTTGPVSDHIRCPWVRVLVPVIIGEAVPVVVAVALALGVC